MLKMSDKRGERGVWTPPFLVGIICEQPLSNGCIEFERNKPNLLILSIMNLLNTVKILKGNF